MELIEVIIFYLFIFSHGWQRGDFVVFLELLSSQMGFSVGNLGGDPRQVGDAMVPNSTQRP